MCNPSPRRLLQHRLVLDYSARHDGRKPADIGAAILAEVPPQERELPKTLKDAKL